MTESLLNDSAACLAFVEKSPQAVTAKNKLAWVGLFADGAAVEDPVGSAPHVHAKADGLNGAVGRFYQTFIAPNDIRFEVDHDVVCARTVCRDLHIHIAMTDKVRISVPMHLLYELGEEDGELRIQRLAAHWELRPMIGQVMGFGFASLSAGTAMFVRMLKNLGVGGVAGFSRAMSSVGDVGKSRVQQLAFALNRNDRNTLSSLMAADFRIAWCDQPPTSIAGWRAAPGKLSLTKLIAAGNWVTASAQLDNDDGSSQRGLLAVRFGSDGKLIEHCALYL